MDSRQPVSAQHGKTFPKVKRLTEADRKRILVKIILNPPKNLYVIDCEIS
jgi:hypothetical protein